MILDLIMQNSFTKRVDENIYPIRVYNILKKEGFDPDSLRYIHVTGSKGKGTIARTSFQFLKASGKKVGLFTSPHIFDVCERIETEQGLISEEALTNLFTRFEKVLRPYELHFFELMLFFGIVYFIEQACEFVVMEVGVGGRFDPTNFCQPEVSLIGQVQLEHREFLGGSLEQIAYNKAGIIKKNIPAFSLPQEPMVKDIFVKEGEIIFLSLDEIQNLHINPQGYSVFSIDSQELTLKRFGKAHVMNFLIALRGIQTVLPLSKQIIQEVAAENIPYRIDLLRANILVDTSHNGESFFYLFDTLRNYLKWNETTLFVTLLQGKEIDEVVQQIKSNKDLFQKVVVFDFDHKRKSDGQHLYQLLKDDFEEIEYCADLKTYPLDPHQKNIFTGSFYSVPVVKDLIASLKN
ncbi:MAG: bifunctional folylpolyglutamate synthase/dihydrofolate synthase [Brevinema sp.]